MNKTLESTIDRVSTWPPGAQDEAARALAAIERALVASKPSSREEYDRKLTALRETINRSIERGSSHSDEDVEAAIAARLDTWERRRKGA